MMPDKTTILVVEDDALTREALNVVLRRDGYEVALATNGAEALASLRRQRPDLILLDMLMPVLDGWHFLEQLKALNPPPAVPMIVVTGTILTREWAADHDCCNCIRKPIDPAKLLEVVRLCLKECSPAA